MRVSVPEPVITGVMCPKCQAMNAMQGHHHIMRVADERGFHRECSVCGTDFDYDSKEMK